MEWDLGVGLDRGQGTTPSNSMQLTKALYLTVFVSPTVVMESETKTVTFPVPVTLCFMDLHDMKPYFCLLC